MGTPSTTGCLIGHARLVSGAIREGYVCWEYAHAGLGRGYVGVIFGHITLVCVRVCMCGVVQEVLKVVVESLELVRRLLLW